MRRHTVRIKVGRLRVVKIPRSDRRARVGRVQSHGLLLSVSLGNEENSSTVSKRSHNGAHSNADRLSVDRSGASGRAGIDGSIHHMHRDNVSTASYHPRRTSLTLTCSPAIRVMSTERHFTPNGETIETPLDTSRHTTITPHLREAGTF